jgi:hypothetical protein
MHPGMIRMDIGQDISISRHFLLGTVPWFCIFHYKGIDAISIDRDAFNPIGRLRALNQCHPPHGFQHFRRLFAVKRISSTKLTQRPHGHGQRVGQGRLKQISVLK